MLFDIYLGFCVFNSLVIAFRDLYTKLLLKTLADNPSYSLPKASVVVSFALIIVMLLGPLSSLSLVFGKYEC